MPNVFFMVQFFFAIVIGLYFFNLLKSQQGNKSAVERESKKELEKLRELRKRSLTTPLSEYTRPSSFEDIVGQENGLKALRATLCSPNPQHVIIYGPPGVGKTAAARVMLEEARKYKSSPFNQESKFIEMDATTLRFDDRGIADPLMGSVHDPIYQGAGQLGQAGIPQPKPGAVTKAHGGMLFLDEIGELHPVQMNKLLKVLEDRKVFLESAYYSAEDENVPPYIHDIFQNGLPADFRLVGATTRMAQDLPPALRSRCVEVYFRPLYKEEIGLIAINACKKSKLEIEERAIEEIKKYATNGRDTVNMIQIAGGVAITENRRKIQIADIQWVVESGHYSPRPEKKVGSQSSVGYINGLAVYGPNMGMVIEIECSAIAIPRKGKGRIITTGIVDREETNTPGRTVKRRSTALDSVDNVLTVIRKYLNVDPRDYDIHLNFPGGIPIDGPSAGITMVTAIFSAIKNLSIDSQLAMTGEISIRGKVKPVGGITAKIEAAKEAGCTRVLIPKDNYQERFKEFKIEVIPVDTIEEVVRLAAVETKEEIDKQTNPNIPLVAALGSEIQNLKSR
ncbi:Sporulation protease LonB [Alkaliphilus metalliredigens QYMF]|uniref:endopeptidase La n=1 Tax=Alkaliphilus metalliredigens (strain QYMF) TaxID=293826 RepID=A6TM65_ALKMQ|nr:ATP-dependent protease LonB [Alkaliphilus metalliredigens]ABR47283.1 Sporulation protease LonB [Alkaliphilus metalliredigens QYMF]